MSFSNNPSLTNFFSQSNLTQLLQASQKNQDYSKSAGRWSKEEHQKFVEGVTKFGKNWKKVEEYIGTRTGAQIRSHAQKFFIRLTKEYKKRSEKNEREGEREKEKEKGRGRSNSIVSNFSNNFELDNELEEEEELENITEQNDEIIEEKQGNQQTETEEPNIQNFEETENKKEGTQTKNKMLPSENKDFQKLIGAFQIDHEELEKKIDSEEKEKMTNNVQQTNNILHYQEVINFFSSMQHYCDSPKPISDAKDIPQNQSFFNFIIKKLENFVRKNKASLSTEESSPMHFRKLSDLVVMPCNDDFKDKASQENKMINNENVGPEKRVRKNSFKICFENDKEEVNKKLENLKRKTHLNDPIEKKEKI